MRAAKGASAELRENEGDCPVKEVRGLLTRIITGVVGMALAAFVIMQGDWLYAVCAILLSFAAWYEYASAFEHVGKPLARLVGFVVISLFGTAAWLWGSAWLVAIATLAVLLVFAEAVFRHRRFAVDQVCFSLAGIFYVGFCFAHLILLRFAAQDVVLATPVGDMTLGCAFLWIMFLGTWSSDTFAYFAGSFFGSRRLCPEISPKKTVEGFLGGLVGTTAVVAALGGALGFSVPLMAFLGVLLACAATVGDLAESLIKRYAGVKDSGRFFPGHGGVLDRFDSVMFTAPFVYYFIQVVGLAGV